MSSLTEYEIWKREREAVAERERRKRAREEASRRPWIARLLRSAAA